MKMHKLHPEDFKFFPKTWVLPNDYPDFVKHWRQNENKTYIVKPDMLSQGKGIFLTKCKDEINPRSNVVVQEYLENPFLVDNLKFDIRLYVLVMSVDPLRIYLFEDGLVRFATVEYQKPTDENIDNTYIHLTNYAINKNNENFTFNDENTNKGHKRTLASFWAELKESGIETDLIQEEIKDIIVKTFLCVQPQLAHQYKSCLTEDIDGSSCFEILGFDIMLDEDLDPYLIEVNHAPSFATDSNLDLNIKTVLLRDTFKMLNWSLKRRNKYKKERNKVAQNRIFTGRKEVVNPEDKDKARKLNNLAKHKFEMANNGHFELLYPLIDEQKMIVGDHREDYYLIEGKGSKQIASKQTSEASTTDGSGNPSPEPKHDPPLTSQEKLTMKYQGFIKDAFEEWDDFTNGFRYKPKYLMPEDDPCEEMGVLRNPNKSKTKVMAATKRGFGSTSTRIDNPLTRVASKIETPTRQSEMKSRRMYTKHQRQGPKLMDSVLSSYVSKSIVVSKEKAAQGRQQNLPRKKPMHWLPVISNPKTLKELQLKSRESQYFKQGSESNKNSTPKLPKVL